MKKLTKKQKKYLFYGLIAVIVVIILWKVLPKLKNKAIDKPDTASNIATSKSYNDDTIFKVTSPMMKDDRVKLIQKAYNYVADKEGWPLITEDGVFGNKTAQAVKKLTGKTNASWSEVKTAHLTWQ